MNMEKEIRMKKSRIRKMLCMLMAVSMISVVLPSVAYAQEEISDVQKEILDGENTPEETVIERTEEITAEIPELEAPVPAEQGILSVTAITDMGLFGQQLAAVAIEYENPVLAESLNVASYEVKALVVDTDGETAAAPVKTVYVSDSASMQENSEADNGKFVIVELQLDTENNTVGRKVSTYYYDNEDQTRGSKGYWYLQLEDLLCSVTQKAAVKAANGTVYGASETAVPASKEIDLKLDEFESLILPSDADGTDLHLWYHLPENYDAAKSYPMVMQMVGGGTSYWEVGDESNYGASLAMDASATAWLDAPEDVIIVSVHSRFDLFNGTPPTEIIQAVKYFEANYSVDTDRVYMTGNSFGTIMAARALVREPKLFAGVILCNGNLGLGKIPGPGSENDTNPEYIAEVLKEVIDQKVAIWFNHGRGDTTAKVEESIVPYETIKSIYESQGMSEKEINAILRLSVFEDDDMEALGIHVYHQATRYAYYTQGSELVKWMLTQSKNNKKPGGGADDNPTNPTDQSAEGFVELLYWNVLNRKSDADGLDSWVKLLKNGSIGGEETAKGFIFSREYEKQGNSDEAFVDMLYGTLLNRKPDAAGKNAWIQKLAEGASREEVTEGFFHSMEFQKICARYGIFTTSAEAFVSRLYTVCLERKADITGLNSWSSLLHSRTIGGAEAAKGFFNSTEFTGRKLSDKEFISCCYRTLLNREADAQGLKDWVSVLNSGESRDFVLNGFIGSAEYGKLCSVYGIDR